MSVWVWVALILGLAAFTQSLTGFGVALVSMPLLSMVIGVKQAAPLVALISLFVEVGILWRYRAHLALRPVLHLAVASFFGVPLGVWGLRHLPERPVAMGLGVVLAGYGLYALAGWRLPKLEGKGWAWGAGWLSGVLGGAYNASGPPVILYGHARQWPPARFKANLQAYFLLNSSLVFLTHLAAGTIRPSTWRLAAWSLPALAAGLVLGATMDRWLSPSAFRKMVLIALVLLGARMLWG